MLLLHSPGASFLTLAAIEKTAVMTLSLQTHQRDIFMIFGAEMPPWEEWPAVIHLFSRLL